ncbi:MAG: hypothetical protein SGJ10_08055 [Bacteroidota bacterium]|nr:hypothetical protein [Bacteroidota bacterium]
MINIINRFNTRIIYILISGIICINACKNNIPNAIDKPLTEKTDSLLSESDIENKILDKLSKLPEWVKENNYIDSFTNHKHGLAVTTEKPTTDKPDFYFRVGYNGEDRFETYFHFYVNPKTFEIKILDLLDGDIVPIAVWRKRELKRKK